MLKCYICQKEFTTRQAVGGHLSTAHPERKGLGRKKRFFQQIEYPVLFCKACGYAIEDTERGLTHTGGLCRLCGKELERRINRVTQEVI